MVEDNDEFDGYTHFLSLDGTLEGERFRHLIPEITRKKIIK